MNTSDIISILFTYFFIGLIISYATTIAMEKNLTRRKLLIYLIFLPSTMFLGIIALIIVFGEAFFNSSFMKKDVF
ncbi:MAG TPA: hypothetical protein DDY71_11120 [Spirochaetia bacterium]|nr:hypothetical protein [Spirochaetia bacterium]